MHMGARMQEEKPVPKETFYPELVQTEIDEDIDETPEN
jgi:hypothetical protein